MPRRNLRIIVFVCLTGVAALLGYLCVPDSAATPSRVLMENGGGAVVFDHQRHSADYKVECGECHHTGSTTKCGACHGIVFDERFIAQHRNTIQDSADCTSCHHQGFGKTVRAHAMHSASIRGRCGYCHHDKEIEERPTNCGTCHKKKTRGTLLNLEDAGHARCGACHEKAGRPDSKYACGFCHNGNGNRERWAEGRELDMDAMKISCSVCHREPKVDELVPNRMNAFHGRCIACHERRGKGPFAKDQCRQCHTN